MRASTIVMIGFAVVFGLLAVLVAQSWVNRQAELRVKNVDPPGKPVPTRTVVVASQPLRFGAQLAPQALREVAWPQEAIPAGTFTSINEMLSGGKRTADVVATSPMRLITLSKWDLKRVSTELIDQLQSLVDERQKLDEERAPS